MTYYEEEEKRGKCSNFKNYLYRPLTNRIKIQQYYINRSCPFSSKEDLGLFLDLHFGDPESEAGWALDLTLDDPALVFSFDLWRWDFFGISGSKSGDPGIWVGLDPSLGLLDDFLDCLGLLDFSRIGESVTRPVDCLLDALGGKSGKSRVLLLLDSITFFSHGNLITAKIVFFSHPHSLKNLIEMIIL